MKKSSFGLLAAGTISLPLLTNACSKPLPPAKATVVSVSPSSSVGKPQPSPIASAKPIKKAPKNDDEFVANFISCEANVNAHFGYMNSLRVRLGVDIIDLDSAPCNIVLDIHGNVSRIVESCEQVQTPEGLLFDFNPTTKANRAKLIAEAETAISIAKGIRQKIEKHEGRCFPGSPATFEL